MGVMMIILKQQWGGQIPVVQLSMMLVNAIIINCLLSHSSASSTSPLQADNLETSTTSAIPPTTESDEGNNNKLLLRDSEIRIFVKPHHPSLKNKQHLNQPLTRHLNYSKKSSSNSSPPSTVNFQKTSFYHEKPVVNDSSTQQQNRGHSKCVNGIYRPYQQTNMVYKVDIDCHCLAGWSGPRCDVSLCGDHGSPRSLVCGNRPRCGAQIVGRLLTEKCLCELDWVGKYCHLPRCVYGNRGADGKSCICVGKYAPPHCQSCLTGYYGIDCRFMKQKTGTRRNDNNDKNESLMAVHQPSSAHSNHSNRIITKSSPNDKNYNLVNTKYPKSSSNRAITAGIGACFLSMLCIALVFLYRCASAIFSYFCSVAQPSLTDGVVSTSCLDSTAAECPNTINNNTNGWIGTPHNSRQGQYYGSNNSRNNNNQEPSPLSSDPPSYYSTVLLSKQHYPPTYQEATTTVLQLKRDDHQYHSATSNL